MKLFRKLWRAPLFTSYQPIAAWYCGLPNTASRLEQLGWHRVKWPSLQVLQLLQRTSRSWALPIPAPWTIHHLTLCRLIAWQARQQTWHPTFCCCSYDSKTLDGDTEAYSTYSTFNKPNNLFTVEKGSEGSNMGFTSAFPEVSVRTLLPRLILRCYEIPQKSWNKISQ